MQSYKIQIIEDDETIAALLTKQLAAWGYQTEGIKDFKNVSSEVARFEPQLILLDIMLPYYNGFHWCTEIRKFSKAPIIFLSSASDNMNIVMAMNMGGDDFISKPFDMNVLIAKINAILRRTYSFTDQTNVIEYNKVILNLADTTLLYDGSKLELTKNEFRILETLFEKNGAIVGRDEIMQKLWESDAFVDDNTLTVNMTRLRKKLEEFGLADFIITKKGLGYMLKEGN